MVLFTVSLSVAIRHELLERVALEDFPQTLMLTTAKFYFYFCFGESVLFLLVHGLSQFFLTPPPPNLIAWKKLCLSSNKSTN